MSKTRKADIVVIGAGSGGLSVAAGAAQMGARTILIEKGKMGGDCLNYGCVPSKALIAAGHAAHQVRYSGKFGVNGHEPEVDFAKVHDHVHGVIAAIAPHDSVERFEGLGVDVIQGAARFVGPLEVEVNGARIRARRKVPLPPMWGRVRVGGPRGFDRAKPLARLLTAPPSPRRSR